MKGLLLAVALLAASATAQAQSTLDVDEKRAKEQQELGTGIPNPDALRDLAKQTFSRPVEQQDEKDLKRLAKEANRYANMVGYIFEEYSDFYRENYRYDFIQEKVVETHDAYVHVQNEFKDFRNKAYLNLGLQAKSAGNETEALLYFRDAFRLSAFDCGKGPAKECIRWLAEQELQKMLGLEKIKAFVTWQTK